MLAAANQDSAGITDVTQSSPKLHAALARLLASQAADDPHPHNASLQPQLALCRAYNTSHTPTHAARASKTHAPKGPHT
jgi:hypothetical protein